MAGGELSHWPICAVCSETWGEPTVVEEYGVPPDSIKRRRDHDETIECFQVVARCSHGRGFRKGTVREQRARVEVPEYWGKAHMDDAIRSLIFFAPGAGSPTHNIVTSIANG